MRRDLAALEAAAFDLVVVGAGIYGACIARDAAMRGLTVALIDKGDLGAATSHNSYKLVHGGLRYLQQLDIRRLRQSALEQRRWLRIAPHLLRPLAFAMPTIGHGTRGPEALRVALSLYELLAPGGEPEAPGVPRGRVVGRNEAQGLIPGLEGSGANGAAIWHDVQMLNADRLLLDIVQDAVAHGAEVANYVAALGFLREGERIAGIAARDVLADAALQVRGKVTINAAGPHAGPLLAHLPRAPSRTFGGLSRAMNLVLARPMADTHAIAASSRLRSDSLVPRRDGRLLFLAPWLGRTVIGTSHQPYPGDPDRFAFDDAWIESFLEELNEAHPPAALTRADVLYCYAGLTPAAAEARGSEVQRSRRGVVIDHAQSDRLGGLISVQGVKYTTARLVAESVVDLALEQIGKKAGPCRSMAEPLPGARGFTDRAALEREAAPVLGATGAEGASLLQAHGTGWRAVLTAADGPGPDAQGLFRARVRHAVRHEMALRLDDVLLRRLDHAQLGRLDEARLAAAAAVMALEQGWDRARRAAEEDRLRAILAAHLARPASTLLPTSDSAEGESDAA